ncbi:MAG: RNA methyltransferase [Pseudomonadota bacterium]
MADALVGRRGAVGERSELVKKPAWVIAKEKARRAEGARTVWLFGLHAVRDALENPRREALRLVVTRNAADKLAEPIARSGLMPELADPRRFPAPLDPGSVHQGAALEVRPLDWGPLRDVCLTGLSEASSETVPAPLVVLLDRVTDPHNVGAILRSAEVFGARAVIAPSRHAAPETGALAKAASGALERQPYLRVGNLGDAMLRLRDLGYAFIGLDGEAPEPIAAAASALPGPLGLVLGAEGPGLRARTRETCDRLARIGPTGGFGSLNVSNAAAVALYAVQDQRRGARRSG